LLPEWNQPVLGSQTVKAPFCDAHHIASTAPILASRPSVSPCAAELSGWPHFVKWFVPMKSQIVKRSVVVAGRKKSINLEETVWRALKEIATYREVTLVALLATIDSTRNQENLSSAVRLFVLNFYRAQLEIRDRHNVIETALRSPIRLH
jgi:predicted DNA-binding ribbon-helix-helix protein